MRSEEKITLVNGQKRRHRVEVFGLGPNDTILVSHWPNECMPCLPGGGMDNNESPIMSAIREQEEEAGWSATSFYEVKLDRDFIFKGEDDKWFNKDGWKEEENIAVACRVGKFSPTAKYGTEDDSLVFNLITIESFIIATEIAMKQSLSLRNHMRCLFRLEVLRKISSQTLTKPAWADW